MNFLNFNKKRKFYDTTINGGINITNTKAFETMAQTISEEDEIMMKMQKEKLKREKEERDKMPLLAKKSPIDEFNWQITT